MAKILVPTCMTFWILNFYLLMSVYAVLQYCLKFIDIIIIIIIVIIIT